MSKYKVCGYDMEVLHARQLEIAAEVDRICRENGFRYSLYGGSVIGAVRHNGFIPWDHDIDLCMPRKDYEKFRKYCKKHPSEKFFFSNYYSEKKYPNNWGKMRSTNTVFQEKELVGLDIHNGVFIDIHPIDNILPVFLKLQVKIASFWACVHHVKVGMKYPKNFKRVIYKIFGILPLRLINFNRDFAMKLFDWLPTKYVYKICHPNNGVYPIKRSTFEDLIEHKFEDKTFFIPKDYDEFLRKRYGNYMEFPPEAEETECCTSITECKL